MHFICGSVILVRGERTMGPNTYPLWWCEYCGAGYQAKLVVRWECYCGIGQPSVEFRTSFKPARDMGSGVVAPENDCEALDTKL